MFVVYCNIIIRADEKVHLSITHPFPSENLYDLSSFPPPRKDVIYGWPLMIISEQIILISVSCDCADLKVESRCTKRTILSPV